MKREVETKSEDEALRAPATWRPAEMEEEALEINPPVRVARLPTDMVDDAERLPDTWRPAEMEEDADEIKPDRRVARP